MTESAHRCAEHSGSMQKLAQVERDINDLYGKHEETTKLLTDLRLEMSRRATAMEACLQGLNLSIGRMEDLLKNQAALEAQRQAIRDKFATIQTQIDEAADVEALANILARLGDNGIEKRLP